MEIFIDYKGMLLTRYEWSQGDKPTDKVLAARQKLSTKGQIKVITDERDFEDDAPKPKIQRKG